MKTFDSSTPLTSKLAILLVGPPGARKTTLALQFPNLYIIDCDGNLAGPARAIKKYNATLSFKYDSVAEKDGKPVETKDQYNRILDLMAEARAATDVEWVCLDGMSALNDILIDKIMAEQKISYMEARNWSTFKSDATKVLFTKARHLGKNLIVTAHEVRIEHNHPTQLMTTILDGYEPFIQGGTRERLGGYFTDVWRLEARLAPGDKIETELTCDKVGLMKQLKNSVGLPHTIKNPTYESLKKLSNGLL